MAFILRAVPVLVAFVNDRPTTICLVASSFVTLAAWTSLSIADLLIAHCCCRSDFRTRRSVNSPDLLVLRSRYRAEQGVFVVVVGLLASVVAKLGGNWRLLLL